MNRPMRRCLAGAFSGLIATVAMTASMYALFDALPKRERYPLPPRLITEKILGPTGLFDDLDDDRWSRVTLAAHYGYGVAAGALYPVVASASGRSSMVTGGVYGLAVWAAGYLGWIPMLGILRPAVHHPAPRIGLMVTAHLVWGVTLGVVADRLVRGRS